MVPGEEQHQHSRAGRQHRSTEDQVTYIALKTEDGIQDKQHTLTVWIDMEKGSNLNSRKLG